MSSTTKKKKVSFADRDEMIDLAESVMTHADATKKSETQQLGKCGWNVAEALSRSKTKKHRHTSMQRQQGRSTKSTRHRHHERNELDKGSNEQRRRHKTKPCKMNKAPRSNVEHESSNTSCHRHHHHHHHHHRRETSRETDLWLGSHKNSPRTRNKVVTSKDDDWETLYESTETDQERDSNHRARFLYTIHSPRVIWT